MIALGCPFCGQEPATAPQDPKTEGNAWGWVFCVNRRCVTYDPMRGHGVCVEDGAQTADERGSGAYVRAAIRRWNRRAEAASPLGGPTLTLDEPKSVPIGGDGEGSSNASLRPTPKSADTEAESAVPCPHCGSILHGVT